MHVLKHSGAAKKKRLSAFVGLESQTEAIAISRIAEERAAEFRAALEKAA